MLIGQPEKLPNIVGNYFEAMVSHSWLDNRGALSFVNRAPNKAVLLQDNISWNWGYIGFNASETQGTGAGVYQTGAHVQPNNVTIKLWLRFA